jgi:aspartyl-tRNA(Asn)/glutamyl-tRNA(Gln) amidotransferase subunit A
VTELADRTLAELRARVEGGEASCREVVEACLTRISAVDSKVQAFVALRDEEALRDADEADAARARGEARGPLHGLPIAVKDIFCSTRFETTCASRILAGFRSPYDATVVRKLREAGLVVIGSLNMDEFAMGSSTENSAYKPTRNPWDTGRIPGGSSGGSAAAVAAREVPWALGSDTGGSIRQPAALCGVVGMKPTYGRVSRYGLVAFASSLDQIGPLARTVADAATLLGVVAGHDPRDSTSLPADVPDYVGGLTGSVEGLRVGLPREFFEPEGNDPETLALAGAAVDELAAAGAKPVEIEAGGDLASPHALRDRGLLPDLHRRGVIESVALRRRPIWISGGGGVTRRDVQAHAVAGVRAGGAAAHPARNVRALGGLLRRVLPQGPEGADAAAGRLRRGLRTLRRHRDADDSWTRLAAG